MTAFRVPGRHRTIEHPGEYFRDNPRSVDGYAHYHCVPPSVLYNIIVYTQVLKLFLLLMAIVHDAERFFCPCVTKKKIAINMIRILTLLTIGIV